MATKKQFSCFLIGEETLPIQCAERLLERGHQIKGIISTDSAVRDWAKGKDIPYFQPSDNLVEVLSQQPFDYLFSIFNNAILPQEILQLPHQYAINFHDAPLPKYAGVNATSWVLMNEEKDYGVTWHVMTELVNGGDILKQVPINIDERETTFTLKVKRYEAAISSFTQLIDELAAGKAVAVKQNLKERTYFSPTKRPNAGGVLSFNRCAYELDALVRALDFGSYPNPLGQAKLLIGSDLMIVSQLEVLDELSKAPPGTITAIEPNFLKVSTISYEIVLRQIQTMEGQPLSIPNLVAKLGLQVGDRFKESEPELAKRIEEFDTLVAKHEAFWVERLTNLQPITIPYAQTKPSNLKEKQYASVKMSIPDEVITFLEKRYPTWNSGDFLLAAFVGYLARIGGTGCFDLGLRNVELGRDLEGTAGFLACCVPHRVEVDYEQSFEAVFEAVRKQMELTKQHKTYARDVVARYPELRSRLELGSEQIFPVVIERVESLEDQVKPNNELTVIIPNNGKECYWLYNIEALDDDSIARMLEQLTIFLQGVVTDSAQCLAYLPLLSEKERHKILVEWNDTEVDYPLDKCIHQLFEEQVERTPDAVAVVFEDQQLTYRELNARANQLAHYLQKLGVGPEILVGICVERSLDLGVVVLGILKAGGTVVPLDPTDPEEQLAFILEDTQLPVLLTQKQLLEERKFLQEASKHRIQIVCVDTILEYLAQEIKQTSLSKVMAENLAYIVYTSGTTGNPKGVMISHRAISSRQLSGQPNFKLTETDRFLLNVYRGLVLHYALLGPLLCGGRVIIARPGGHQDSTYLAELIAKQKVTSLYVVPSLLPVFLQEESLKTCNCLRQIFCGSEALPIEFQKHFFENLDADLYNIYGLTEATFSTLWKCQRGSKKGFVPIGRPTVNTQVYLLDSYRQPVPIGVPGHLYIGGEGLARGYLNRPNLTAERFIPNLFSKKPGALLYNTGDLACYLADGSIKYLGRIDRQVKVRGYRIELGEIETVLGKHPAVQQTVVLAREDTLGDKRLVAYVVPKRNQVPTFNQLRSFLTEKVPHYMVPSTFMFLDFFPLMSSGKVDCRELPAPGRDRPDIEETFVTPRTSVEKVLASIWAKVLNVEQVGVYDNFFVIGGNSLLGTQLISSVRKIFQVKLPLTSLFETPTLVEMSQSIISHQEKPGTAEKIAMIMQKIKNMSVDEMREMLQKKKKAKIQG